MDSFNGLLAGMLRWSCHYEGAWACNKGCVLWTKNGSSQHRHAVIKVLGRVWQCVCSGVHIALCLHCLRFSNSTHFGFRLNKVSFGPMVFAPSMFLTGLRVFSVEIIINLFCTDKSGPELGISKHVGRSLSGSFEILFGCFTTLQLRVELFLLLLFCICLTHSFVLVFSSFSPFSFSLFFFFWRSCCDFFLFSLPVSLSLSHFFSFWC